jgi:hypothetical protein
MDDCHFSYIATLKKEKKKKNQLEHEKEKPARP